MYYDWKKLLTEILYNKIEIFENLGLLALVNF